MNDGRKKKMKRRIGFFYIDGKSMEYSMIGAGEPILIFHGGHSNCYEEFGIHSLVEKGYSVIIPSRAGYGNTSKEIGKDLQTACSYYRQLLHHLNLNKVHVIAISAGSPSGIYFASHYPDYVRTLILQSAVTKEWLTPQDKDYKIASYIFHPNFEKLTWKLLSFMNTLFPHFIFRQMFSSFSELTYKDAKNLLSKDDVTAIKRMNKRQRSGHGFFLDLAQVDELTIQDLRAIHCPTLIMHSKNDGSVPLDHPYHAHENITDSQLCLLESWGHLIWMGGVSKDVDKHLFHFLQTYKIFGTV